MFFGRPKISDNHYIHYLSNQVGKCSYAPNTKETLQFKKSTSEPLNTVLFSDFKSKC